MKNSVNVNGENHDAEKYETVKMKNSYIHLQLDTGAKCNVLASTDLKKIDKNTTFVVLVLFYYSMYGRMECCRM